MILLGRTAGKERAVENVRLLAYFGAASRRFRRHHADVRDVVAFVHRGHGAYVQDDARRVRMTLEDRLSEVLGDLAELQSLAHKRSALDPRIKHAGHGA